MDRGRDLPTERFAAPQESTRRGGVLLLFPAFNESAALPAVLDEARRAVPAADLLVVDDGSEDDTAAAARRGGAEVLTLPFNAGIGVAVQTGLLHAAAARYDAVVRLDADGQHPPAEISRLLDPVLRGEFDLLIGSRFLGNGSFQSSAARRAGIRWFRRLVHLFAGVEVTDPTSGFVAMSPRAVALLASDCASDYPEIDAIVRLARAGMRVGESPISMRPRASGQSSIRGVRSARYMIRITLAVLASRFGPVPGPGRDRS